MICRLQAVLQAQEAGAEEKISSKTLRIQELERQAAQTDELMNTQMGSQDKVTRLAGARNSLAAAAFEARQGPEVILLPARSLQNPGMTHEPDIVELPLLILLKSSEDELHLIANLIQPRLDIKIG